MTTTGLAAVYGVLARQNAYANRVLFTEALQLGQEALEEAGSPSRESVHQLLCHLTAVEDNYLSQIRGVARRFNQTSAMPLTDVAALADETSRALLDYVTSLTEPEFERVVEFRFSTGALVRYPVWQILTQILIHSTHHRGELSVLLSALGRPLPIDDIIVRFTDESGQDWPFRQR